MVVVVVMMMVTTIIERDEMRRVFVLLYEMG